MCSQGLSRDRAMDSPLPVPQRRVRPFSSDRSQWRQQLPNKYLAVAVRGDVPALRQMLKANPEFLNKRGNHNRTLLWEAARRGRLAAVNCLVARGQAEQAEFLFLQGAAIGPYSAQLLHRPFHSPALHPHVPA
jgi:hypothetical protein